MKFVKIDKSDIPVGSRPTSRSASLFNEFLGGNPEVGDTIEITLEEGDKTIESVRSSLDNYIGRHDLKVRVYTSSGRLFIEATADKASERPKAVRKPRKPKGDVVVVDEAAEVVAEAAMPTPDETVATGGRRNRNAA